MLLNILKSKIHRVKVTDANLEYVGSITIDENLMDAAGIVEFERVQVVDVTNGARIETYVIKGERGSGVICLNGAAAHLFNIGDIVIIMAYTWLEQSELEDFKPKIVFPVDNLLD
jgi:aspartate 1-decarboxylase